MFSREKIEIESGGQGTRNQDIDSFSVPIWVPKVMMQCFHEKRMHDKTRPRKSQFERKKLVKIFVKTLGIQEIKIPSIHSSSVPKK